MMHLVRIGLAVHAVPESEVWRAAADYGPITDEVLRDIYDPDSDIWLNEAAKWLHERGL